MLESQLDRSVATELLAGGFAHLRAQLEDTRVAWELAIAVFREAAREDADMPPPAVVGEFNIPPPGAHVRDYQTLHIDFGVPIVPGGRRDVARFTALYVDRDRARTTALTRIVRLAPLLAQRDWVEPELLEERLRRYGRANAGAEGILARLVEAADDTPTLPRAGDGGLLCGMEFDSLVQERAHFARLGLHPEAVEQRERLDPGDLLLLDNLATAHGRLGVREPLELHQLCVGYRGLDADAQSVLLRRILQVFRPQASRR